MNIGFDNFSINFADNPLTNRKKYVIILNIVIFVKALTGIQ